MAEYTLQAAILLLLGLVLRRFKLSYLFSFGTAVVYGFALVNGSIIGLCAKGLEAAFAFEDALPGRKYFE